MHVEVPKMPPRSMRKRGLTKLADRKAKATSEPLLPHTIYQSASMSSNAHPADIILAPSDIKGSEPDSAFNSYPPKIPLDRESNELGLFNGADMAYDIPSSSLNQEGYSNLSTTHNLLAFTTSGYEDAMPPVHVRPYQSATKNESSPYLDFEHSSKVGAFRAWTAWTNFDMQPCDSDSLITSHPQEPSMGNTLSKRPVMDVQTTPGPLHPANMYWYSGYRNTDLVNSMLDPRTFPVNDPPTLRSLVGDDESQVSEPSGSSMLHAPVQQMSHYTGASGMSAPTFLRLPAKASGETARD